MNEENSKLIEQLKENLNLLEQSIESMKLSLNKCKSIGIKKNFNFEESESFDSLTSKFARISDLYLKKLLKTIMLLLHENIDTFIDRANFAEKIGLILSAERLILIRDLRNRIAHEYLPEDIHELIAEVFIHSENLINEINQSKQFIEKRNWL
ncbi:MAG: hypothetical protein QNJ31_04515 [Candidatus Caenarcaniphilales bacterium]|nr:hypothetical protein [Candidatus Caenarcaniphilales bacterium]